MKQQENKSENLVTVSKKGFLTLIASHLKGKILFPKKMEEAKKILDHARLAKER